MKTTIITALLLAASLASAKDAQKVQTTATACFEAGGSHVRLVDTEGKKHRYAVFVVANGTDQEFADFEKSRKVVAMDDAANLTIKQGKDDLGNPTFAHMKAITECPASKRAKFPKL